VAETIKITSVYGVKDNGELVNIVVEGNSDEIPYILLTIWGKKLNRNMIRQISSGEFNESIEQEIIKSAQCECGDQITIKAFCLANSAISDTWQGELQCLEIGKEPAVTVAEGLETEEVEEVLEIVEVEGVKEIEEEKAGLPESLPLEIPVLEEEEEAAVIVAEDLEAEEVEEGVEIVEVEEAKEIEEEKVSLPESLPLEIPALEKEEEPTARIIEDHEVKEEKESVPKSFLFPTIEITTVKGFTYKRKLVDIVVEGNSTGGNRILIKIQWGNIKFYKIVSPSSSGEFKSSFEQDISRSAHREGGDRITVTALSLANSAIFDTWQEKFHCVEKAGETDETQDKDIIRSDHA
jgi:hypothetical protein